MQFNIQKDLKPNVLKQPIREFCTKVDTAFHIHTTLGELLEILRTKKIEGHVHYFYAVDEQNRLYGVLSTRDILFNPAHTRLIEIVDEDIVTLYYNVTVEHALKVLEEHQFLSVPMVDDEYRLMGLFEIKPKDMNFGEKFQKRPARMTQDVFQLIGFNIEQEKMNTKLSEYRHRMPWLFGNLVAGLICAGIASFFQATLSQVIVLSMFIPLVLTLSESISMQSMTIILYSLHHKEVTWFEIFKRIFSEWYVALLLGITSVVFIALYYFGRYGDLSLNSPLYAIGISVIVSMISSASIGTLFPLILYKLNLNLRVAVGPIILMITDILTTAVYMIISTWMLIK